MLKCRELSELSSDYLDGKLSFFPRLKIWWHLVGCVHCRRYIEQLKLVTGMLRQAPPAQAEENEVDKIMGRIEQDQLENDTGL